MAKMTSGTQLITSVAAALTGATFNEVIIQNSPVSTQNVKIGDVSNQYFTLTPGAAITLDEVLLSGIFMATSTGSATVNWIGEAR
jgi:hypothetical protein